MARASRSSKSRLALSWSFACRMKSCWRAARQQDFIRQAKDQLSVSRLFDDREALAKILGAYTSTDIRGTTQVLELIKRVRDNGLPVILISHNMPHVFEIADRIHVHRLGKRVAVVDPKETSMHDVVGIMTGAVVHDLEHRELEEGEPGASPPASAEPGAKQAE